MASPAPAPSPTLSAAELAEYLLDLGGTLLSYGCSTHRLEAVLRAIAALEGYQADAFAVPTGLFLSLRSATGEPGLVRMVRVKDWAVDLERLALTDRIFNDVIGGKLTLAQARRRLDEVEARPAPYPAVLRWLASAGAAGAAAVFFRGGLAEVGVAALGGLVLGLGRSFARRAPRLSLLQDFLGGLLAALLAFGATTLWPGLSREVLVLSVVILLVPGLALTNGLAELAHKNLVSGAAKLMEALMVFISIIFGIAAAIGLEQLVGWRAAAAAPHPPPGYALEAAALVVASLAFGVIFSVPRRLLAWAALSGGVGWVVTALSTRTLPPALSAFSAAAAVCLFANLQARLSSRPAQLFLLPGLVLLVPGSFGFLSLEAFLRGEFLGGAAKGFEMFLIAGAIVTGLLVANVVLPARKLL